eukprot:CAMPEP_0183747528 /NCGR_PEP_ID=MMETSP0737-20130205/67311_1 /TAXON_ID=385413 /ORGANISM="Thalassiosira miniscula, Strain CCMP1093" /LENGTH=561 /DNA_ID=CAMNT_0025983241 /DNA_START=86 /DNA_END=1768 /DNA_ORIENTATION=-
MTVHHPSTYVAGEDEGRLVQAALDFGLEEDQARRPLGNIRRNIAAMLMNDTLESARMHSVGVLGNDEHVDTHGNVHKTLTIRRRKPVARVKVPGSPKPDYGGDLQNLFQQGPLEMAKEEEEEEEETIDVVEGGSLTAAVFGIIKGTIGPAILFLPRGFQLSGYAVAIPLMSMATIAYVYSAHRLLECWRVEKDKAEKLDEIRALLLESSNAADYGTNNEDGKASQNSSVLLTYPELARRAFGEASIIVQAGIALLQFGVCLTYFIFVPQNLYEATKVLFGVEVNILVFIVAMVVIEVPMSWIRDIRKLTPFNVLATFLIAFGLASCLLIATWEIAKDPNSNYVDRLLALPPANKDTWYLFIGTAFYEFEGCITLIVPLQEAVFREEDKKKFPSMNQAITTWIVAFYMFFSLTCWAAFGESVKSALTASLPPGLFSAIVQLAYSIAVIFTFPLQAFPALEVVFHHAVGGRSDPSEATKLNTMSSIIVCLLAVVAYSAIDYLGNVASLLGSLVGIPIALICPALMHNKLVKNAPTSIRRMNYLVAGVGVIATGVTTFTTIVSW